MTSRPVRAARRATRLLVVLVAASTGVGAQTPDALSILKREGRIACRPAEPYFCANVHVSCVGRTTVPTFPFSLRITPTGAALEAAPDAEAFVEHYAAGQVEWDAEGLSVIVRPAGSNGYIRVFQDGRYVFRHYPSAEGVMSLGMCG